MTNQNPNDPKIQKTINDWLTQLENSLGQITSEDRAAIIMELSSHIHEALDHDAASLNEILNGLGEPQTVANRYLLERGLKPVRRSKAPIFKYLTQAFLGCLAFLLLMTVLLLYFFTPLLKITNEGVTFLGGLLTIEDRDRDTHDEHFENDKIVEGELTLSPSQDQPVILELHQGRMEISSAESGNVLKYRCRFEKAKPAPVVNQKDQSLQLDKGGCDIQIPATYPLKVNASQGKITLTNLNNPIVASISQGKIELSQHKQSATLEVNQGKISIIPAEDVNYKYDLNIAQGKIDAFTSSEDPQAFIIKATVNQGKIDHDE